MEGEAWRGTALHSLKRKRRAIPNTPSLASGL